MEYIVSAGEMKSYDKAAMEVFGMPSLVLMERAALSVVEELERRLPLPGKRVLIAAGCGNNGGDGVAVGRLLMQKGCGVDFLLAGEREKCTEETARQLETVCKYGGIIQGKTEGGEYDIIVDALFGVGLSRKVEGKYAELVDWINRSGAFVCSADIPSGICADSGKVLGTAVKASLTVTFAFRKLGHILYPGCEYAGEMVCRDIGITEHCFLSTPPKVFTYGGGEAARLLSGRRKNGNKGSFGKVLAVAGSEGMCGAALLCGRAAYRMGAGMVKIMTAEENRVIVQTALPEALFVSWPEEGGERLGACLSRELAWADVIVAGPGLGRGEAARLLLLHCLRESELPILLDADALNLIACDAECRQAAEEAGAKGRTVVLTPHLGEFARLFGCEIEEAADNLLVYPKELADRWHCTVICKDARTVTAGAGEEGLCLNTSGNCGMATAGSGDVLAGMAAALLGQGMNGFQAAAAAVRLHGLAGDAAAERKGTRGMMAGDIVECLPGVLKDEEPLPGRAFGREDR